VRTFDVLVRREVYEWETVEAENKAAVEARYGYQMREPGRTMRVFADRIYPVEPIMKHGRVLVTYATDTCGPDHKKLLYLDCGHHIYIDPELWYPTNPYVECTNTKCSSRLAAA
jgi:hypothetical protein